MDKTATERYLLLHFVPRYKMAECIVRITYSYKGVGTGYVEFDIDHGFRLYFTQYEPRAFFSLRPLWTLTRKERSIMSISNPVSAASI